MSYQITYYKPERQGIFFDGEKCMLAVEFCTKQYETCGLLFWDAKGQVYRKPASAEGKQGTLFGFVIEGEGLENCTYQFYERRGFERIGEQNVVLELQDNVEFKCLMYRKKL